MKQILQKYQRREKGRRNKGRNMKNPKRDHRSIRSGSKKENNRETREDTREGLDWLPEPVLPLDLIIKL